MHWLDIVILVVAGVAIFLGLRIGIIKAALSLAGVIVGVILAGRFYAPLAEQLSFISQAGVAEAVAFAIILIGVMVVAGVLAAFLRRAASLVMLGWVNHLGGAAFGLVLGAVLCGALLAIWGKFFDIADIVSQSGLAAILLDRFPAVLALLPEEFDTIRSFFQ
jgi:membrane protein required for colicin V production